MARRTGVKLDDLEITEVQRLTLRPGDILVVRVKSRISAKYADEISGRLRGLASRGIKVMVLPEDMSLEVIQEVP